MHSPLEDEPILGGDLFSWPHSMSLGEALFVEDDAAERDMKDAASRSCKRVWAALAKMGIVVAIIARLGEES
jgi:hypothetical protein